MKITKSSGIQQDFDVNKIIKVIEWACENTNINPYDFYDKVQNHFFDGIKTSEVQDILIKVASNMITTDEPDYQFVASNLYQFALRKSVYGRFDPTSFYYHIERLIEKQVYDKEILLKYSKEDIEYLESKINHNLDFTFTYAGTCQLKDKYLVQDRSTGEIFETPQYAFMLIAMCLHQDEPAESRLAYVVDFYNAVSQQKISLPTPVMAGVRTSTRQFSSCTVIEADDSLDGINAASAAIVKYVSRRAGIGLNAGMIRAEGSKIRGGEVKHTGVIPFWKHFQTGVGSSSQGGIRKGSATVNWPVWHLEFENLIVLKNNKGVDENRIRHMDYCVQLNDLMVERFLNNDYITLFSPDVANGELYKAYYSDKDKFKQLYESLERDPLIRKKKIKAVDVFNTIATERGNTARVYIQFVDNVNSHTPYDRTVDPITMTNLCCEIAIPTRRMGTDEALINLCTLSAFVLDKFDYKDQDEVNRLSRVMVRALDNLLDYQDYPVKEALGAKEYRSLGVGVTNYAAFLASNMVSYQNANKITHELFERLQYGLIGASCELAKDRGPAKRYKDTRYAKGELPIDWYKKQVDELVKPEYVLDWEKLRQEVATYGLRNTTLSALMPCESSSQVSNSTNGIEPPRGPVSVKQSKGGTYNQVVPNYEQNQLFYDYAWELAKRGNKHYLNQVAIMQKFVDQAISLNTYYNPNNYRDNKVPMSEIIEDILYCWYYGCKSMYYHNTNDGAGTSSDDEIGCESCKL